MRIFPPSNTSSQITDAARQRRLKTIIGFVVIVAMLALIGWLGHS